MTKSRFTVRGSVFGLRDFAGYKAYRRGDVHYIGHKNSERLRRVQLSKACCEHIASMSAPSFARTIESMLQIYKIRGDKHYYEVSHGR